MPPIRVASTPYLNALPLTWGFLHGPLSREYDVSFHSPSACAQRLREGEADVALIPSIEYQRIPGIGILPGIGIGAKGRVGSVLLFSRVRLKAIGSVAVDAESRTAVALLDILLRSGGRDRPEFTSMPADLDRMLRGHDAALIIGDRALRSRPAGLKVYDLAWEWRARTGLPFVFAFWAARIRPRGRPAVDPRPFLASRRTGVAAIDRIARERAPAAGIEPERAARYLRRNIHYHLGTAERRSLERFYRLALAHRLIPSRRDLRLHREAKAVTAPLADAG